MKVLQVLLLENAGAFTPTFPIKIRYFRIQPGFIVLKVLAAAIHRTRLDKNVALVNLGRVC